ncbi:hypothetical protein HHI36_014571 [Cryptolaemus montrouzieri]|uniref:Uncharacterized protein n=1 Tax=Cryptolaemus montrouzieri TaxID=559131 RepID=A0ABD2N3W4_9CUCU
MNDNDMEQLAKFLGHTLGIHRSSYRFPDEVYQTAKLSKLLILMEKGKAGEFRGKTLDEIYVQLDEDLLVLQSEDNRKRKLRRMSTISRFKKFNRPEKSQKLRIRGGKKCLFHGRKSRRT